MYSYYDANYQGSSSPFSGDTQISTNAATLASRVTIANGNAGRTKAFVSRAEAAASLASLSGLTEAQKESLVGKLMSILTVRQNYFSIIVLAQSIKDVGNGVVVFKDLDGLGPSVTTANENASGVGFDINGDGQVLTTSINKSRPAATYELYDQYVDEITGEQKIMAIVYRDAYTNELKVLRYEFLE
jgi:hypothetical protein